MYGAQGPAPHIILIQLTVGATRRVALLYVILYVIPAQACP